MSRLCEPAMKRIENLWWNDVVSALDRAKGGAGRRSGRVGNCEDETCARCLNSHLRLDDGDEV
jgi:hypothetical protein